MTDRTANPQVVLVGLTPTPNIDQPSVRSWLNVIRDTNPGRIIGIGLHHRGQSPSAPSHAWHDDCGRLAAFTAELRNIYDGPVGLHLGDLNASGRQATGTCRCQEVIRHVDWLPAFHPVAPGWIIAASSQSRSYPGQAAFDHARTRGVCVALGGTASLGAVHEASTTHGRTTVLTGLEIGRVDATPINNNGRPSPSGFAVLHLSAHSIEAGVVRLRNHIHMRAPA